MHQWLSVRCINQFKELAELFRPSQTLTSYYQGQRECRLKARGPPMPGSRKRGDSFPLPRKVQLCQPMGELGRPPCSTQVRPYHIPLALSFKLRGGASDPLWLQARL